MGRGLLAVVCSCLLALSAPGAHAEYFLTVNDLYRECQGSSADEGVCTGYVIEVFDHWAAERAARPFRKPG